MKPYTICFVGTPNFDSEENKKNAINNAEKRLRELMAKKELVLVWLGGDSGFERLVRDMVIRLSWVTDLRLGLVYTELPDNDEVRQRYNLYFYEKIQVGEPENASSRLDRKFWLMMHADEIMDYEDYRIQ